MRTLGFVLCLAAPACGSVKGTEVDAAPKDTSSFEPTDYRYVVDRLNVPTNGQEVMQFGLDLDEDGTVDNQLGSIITQFRTVSSDPSVATQTAIDRGTTIMLLELTTVDLTNTADAALSQFTGLSSASSSPRAA